MLTSSEIKRLIKIKDSGDFGIFTLAVYSLLEHLLRTKYNAPFKSLSSLSYNGDEESRTTFWRLFTRYRDEFFETHEGNADALRVAPILQKHNYALGYDTANGVRHDFKSAGMDAGAYATSLLKAFFEAEKSQSEELSSLQGEIEELFEILSHWDRSKAGEDSTNELLALKNKIRLLEKDAVDVAAYKKTLGEKEKEIKKLLSERGKIEKEIKSLSSQKEKADALKIRLVDIEAERQKAESEAKEYILQNEKAQECLNFMAELLSYSSQRSRYERYLMNLSADQKSVLDKIDFSEDFFIKGEAGTGKTIVLIKAMLKARDEGKSVKLLSFSASLAKYNTYVSSLLSGTKASAISTVRGFINRLMRTYLSQKSIDDNFFKTNSSIFACEQESEDVVIEEAKNVIWARQLSEQQYMLSTRSSIALKDKKARKAVWEAVKSAQTAMENMQKIPEEYAVLLLLKAIGKEDESSEWTDCTFVDEVQDISESTIRLIKLTTRAALICAGDDGQAIFRTGGLSESVSQGEIKTNFRNTREIFTLAQAYRGESADASLAFRPGLPVGYTECKDGKEIMEKIAEKITFYTDSFGYLPGEICVIFPLKRDLESASKVIQERCEKETVFISDKDFSFSDTKKIRLCTLSSCKGLDFPVVLFAAHSLRIFHGEQAELRHSNMIYVALTRAMEKLEIFSRKGTQTKPVIALKAAFDSVNA